MGRPSSFTDAVADEICKRLAEGESLNAICKSDHLPTRQTVYNWCLSNKEFLAKYADARDVGLDRMADDLLEIADDGRNDWMAANDPDNPGYKFNGEYYQRCRLRVDTRKWYLSKLAPKRYGERIEHVGADGKDLIPQASPEEVARKIAFLLAQGMK